MKRVPLVILAVLGILSLSLALFFGRRASDPAYGGKRLSAWVRDMDGYAGPKMDGAKHAVRQIGSDAVPYAIRLLRAKDTVLELRLNQWLAKQSWTKFRFSPAKDLVPRGLFACEALGTNARVALPELTALLSNPDFSRQAAYVLAAFGPEATPILTNAAAHAHPKVRFSAIISMALLKDPSIVPFLLDKTNDPDGWIRAAAVEVLANVATDPGVVVPPLIKSLQDPDTQVRSAGAYGLANWVKHSQAQAAVPFLVQALRDTTTTSPGDSSSQWLRKHAANALKKLDPQAAATAGLLDQ